MEVQSLTVDVGDGQAFVDFTRFVIRDTPHAHYLVEVFRDDPPTGQVCTSPSTATASYTTDEPGSIRARLLGSRWTGDKRCDDLTPGTYSMRSYWYEPEFKNDRARWIVGPVVTFTIPAQL